MTSSDSELVTNTGTVDLLWQNKAIIFNSKNMNWIVFKNVGSQLIPIKSIDSTKSQTSIFGVLVCYMILKCGFLALKKLNDIS